MSGDWLVVAARFLQFASMLVLCGASAFFLYAPRAADGLLRPARILLAAASGAFAATILWACGQTAVLNGSLSSGFDPSSVWSVLIDTRIGRLVLGRLAVIVIALGLFVVLRSKPTGLWKSQALLGALLVASLAWSGHGVRDHGALGALHTGADILHLWCAALWLGALVPLALLVSNSHRAQTPQDQETVVSALTAFSGIGFGVVAVLTLTGVVNGWLLIGPSNWHGLFTTAYGISLLVKLVLFGAMIVLAAANRYVLTPALQSGSGLGSGRLAVRRLRMSVITETALAFIVLGVVAFLGVQPPPISIH